MSQIESPEFEVDSPTGDANTQLVSQSESPKLEVADFPTDDANVQIMAERQLSQRIGT